MKHLMKKFYSIFLTISIPIFTIFYQMYVDYLLLLSLELAKLMYVLQIFKVDFLENGSSG